MTTGMFRQDPSIKTMHIMALAQPLVRLRIRNNQ